jgi:hypothetical protein
MRVPLPRTQRTWKGQIDITSSFEVRLRCLLLSDLADVQAAQSRQDESITSRRQAVVLFEEKYGYAALDTVQYTESLAKVLVMEMTSRMEEAVQLFSSTLEQIERGSATDISSLSGTIGTLCFLRASYTKLGRDEEWGMLNLKLHQIQRLPMGFLGSLDIFDNETAITMSIADYYSGLDDLETA